MLVLHCILAPSPSEVVRDLISGNRYLKLMTLVWFGLQNATLLDDEYDKTRPKKSLLYLQYRAAMSQAGAAEAACVYLTSSGWLAERHSRRASAAP